MIDHTATQMTMYQCANVYLVVGVTRDWHRKRRKRNFILPNKYAYWQYRYYSD